MKQKFIRTALIMLVLIIVGSLPALAGTKVDSKLVDTVPLWMVGGLVINAASLAAMQKNFKSLYKEAFDAAEVAWPKLAMESPSVGAGENYQWLGDLPEMREWLGDKFINQLTGYDYYLKNIPWESTLAVDRDDMNDDRLGIYRPRVMGLAGVGKQQPDKLLSAVRVAGTAQNCYDGKKFYATNHSVGKSGTLSNLITGTGITAALIAADFRTARANMRKYKTETGRPFIQNAGKLTFIAVIPAALEGVFEDLLNQTVIGGTTNVMKGAFDYVIDPFLTDETDWYLDYNGASIRAFIFQNRENPELVALDDPNSSEIVFMKKKFLFSVEARNNVGYGLWQFSTKITNT